LFEFNHTRSPAQGPSVTQAVRAGSPLTVGAPPAPLRTEVPHRADRGV